MTCSSPSTIHPAADPEALMSAALDAAPSEVAILDDRGVILAVNAAWRRFGRENGYENASSGVGLNYLGVCDSASGDGPAEASEVASGLRAVLSGRQEAAYVEYPCDSPTRQRWFQVRVSGFDYEGRRYAVITHESLTESKLVEQQYREKLEELAHNWRLSSLGELASGMAHELNQPLGAISNYMNGCLRRLERGDMDSAQLEKAIRDCAELASFAAGIIRRMRSFASQSSTSYCEIDLNQPVRQAIDLAVASASAKRQHLRIALCEDLPHIRGDAVQMQQVALNLIRNAADSVREAGVRDGRVEVQTGVGEDGMAFLRVADNGGGLKAGDKGKLFQPFYSTKARGMGLGLSICKTIAEVHGGTMTARDRQGGGAVFELRLPVLPARLNGGQSRDPHRSSGR
ncbi:MAG: ATP-binding protein [Planctomycetota bacterium]